MRRSVRFGLFVIVIVGLVGGVFAWVSIEKTITLNVDGTQSQVQTAKSSVRDVLADAGYRAGSHDIVAPALTSSVHNGSHIVFKRGRLLDLTIDGKHLQIWVTSPTVAGALAQLGYSDSVFASVSRSKRLPLGTTDIELRTPKSVEVLHDGQTQTVSTTDATVGDLLTDLGLNVGAQDRLSAATASALTSGEQVQLQRGSTAQVVETTAIAATMTTQPDATLAVGQTKVTAAPKPGTLQTVWSVVYLDGVAVGRTQVSQQILAAAVAGVTMVGTKPIAATVTPVKVSTPTVGKTATTATTPTPPAASVVVSPGSAQAIAQQLLLARGWGADQFSCLNNIWSRESGWRVNAANPSGAYGIPQALPGSKMGPGWQTDATVQITWGIGYIAGRYGTPCGAWSFWQGHNWY